MSKRVGKVPTQQPAPRQADPNPSSVLS